MRFRFVHAADLHLDTPFQGVARVSEQAAARLQDASLEAFDRLVSLAIENEVAFVLLAGDIYEGEARGVRAQLRFLSGLERLAEQGIQTFIVHGNHDPLGGWSAIDRWPAGVTVFGSDRVEAVPVVVGDTRLATVWGISYARSEVSENLSLRFPRGGAADPGAGLRIGLLHASVGDRPEDSSYAPCSLADLTGAPIDYWALGHIHRSTILRDGDPWIVYPGNTQGRSPKPAETGAKGVILVEAEGRHILSVESVPCDSVRFVTLDLALTDLPEEADLAGLRGELMGRALALQEQNPGRALLVRAVLLGRGPLHAYLATPGARADLLRELRDSTAALDPPLWWEDLRDQTAADIDLAVVRSRDDFTSSLLSRADVLAHDPQEYERLRGILTPQSPVDLARRAEPLADEEVQRLLRAATLLAVEALEEEGPSCG